MATTLEVTSEKKCGDGIIVDFIVEFNNILIFL